MKVKSSGRSFRRTAIAGVGLTFLAVLAACGSSTAGPPSKHPATTTTTGTPSTEAASTTSSTAASTAASTTTTPTTAPTTSGSSGPTATFGSWTGTEPTIIYFSGDATNDVSGLTWSYWNNQSAEGHGSWGYDNCAPNCAQGSVTRYPTTVTLSDAVSGQFTHVTETQSGPYGSTLAFTLPDPSLSAS